MTVFSYLPFVAAAFSLLLGLASLLRRKPSPATWCFFAGMAVLAADSLFTGLSLRGTDLSDALGWLTLALMAKSFLPAAWLGFSLVYSRGDYRESLAGWGIPLAIVALLPIGLGARLPGRTSFRSVPAGPAGELLLLRFGSIGTALNVILLVAFVLVLMNLEQTFRSAVGTMRWRIKYVVLGLAVIFGAHVYVSSEAILFSTYNMALSSVESIGLLIGCLFLALAYARTGFAEIDVYPSRAVLRSSLTVLIVGGYLFIVGVLAQVVRRYGGAESFQLQVFVVLLGMAGLAVLLLSDRLRQRIHGFVGRHFRKARHDSGRIWTESSRRLANVKDRAGLCAASARLISETFDVLSATIWLLDERTEQFVVGASTARPPAESAAGNPPASASSAVATGLREKSWPFDLEEVSEPWAGELRQLNPTTFPNGGHRWCVPLRTGERERGRPRPGRPRERGAVHGGGTRTAAVHRPPDDVGALEPPAGERGGARQRTGSVSDDVGVLRARPEERRRVAQPDAEEPAGALRRPGVSRRRVARRRQHRAPDRRHDLPVERPAPAARLQAGRSRPESNS